MNLHCIMQYGTETYKTQRKGIAEVFDNFILLIISVPKMASCHGYSKKKKKERKRKKKKNKATFFLQNSFQANVPCLYPLKTSGNLNLWFSDIFRVFRSGTLT